MKKPLSIDEKINLFIENGVTDEVIRQLLLEAYHSDTIHFDHIGNPYWEASGDSLDPNVELDFGDED